MGRLFLAFTFCVTAFGFSLPDLGLSHAGRAIAEYYNAKPLLEFDPATVAHGFKLQDAQGCGLAWQRLAGLLAVSDNCSTGLLVLTKSLYNASWDNGAISYYLHSFCAGQQGYCIQKYKAVFQNMTGECGGFNPHPAGYGVLGNKTDNIARTVRTLVEAICEKEDVSFYAPASIDPLNSSQTIYENTYPVTYSWMKFANLVATNITFANATVLDGVCTNATNKITDWLIKNAVNQLAVGARQARSFCDKNPAADGGYCAIKVMLLQMKNADPNFKTNPTPENLGFLCNPCVKWGMRLANRIQDMFEEIGSPAFNPDIRKQLKPIADALSYSCARNAKGVYCATILAQYNLTSLQATFTPCLVPKCKYVETPDPCEVVVLDFYRKIGCCLAYFQRTLLKTPGAAAYAGLVSSIMGSCKFTPTTTPYRCAESRLTATFNLQNVAFDFIKTKSPDLLKIIFAKSLGIDPLDILGNVTCMEGSNKNTSCVVVWYPDDTQSGKSFIAQFPTNLQNGLYLTELDYVSIENSSALGGALVDPTQPAYVFDAASVTVTEVNDCLNFKAPVQATFNADQQKCVAICENGAKDGDESDVDCGGSACPSCGLGVGCTTAADCDPMIEKVTCFNNCSGAAGNCKKVCAKGFASALMANPLIVLVACLISLALL